MCAHGMRNSNRLLHGDKLDERKFLLVDHATCPGHKFSVTGMLTCNLFV